MRRTFILVMSVVALASCRRDDANYLELRSELRQPLDVQTSARIEQPGRTAVVTNADFAAARLRENQGVQIATARNGNMHVVVVAMRSIVDTIARAEVDFTLVGGYVYSMSIVRMPAGSQSLCIGCDGYKRFPLRGSEAASSDSIWVYYTARAPCKDCVY